MTQEEKDLVLQDLCARLPYGVYVQIVDRVGLTHTLVELKPEVIQKMWSYKSIKPYLRPLSSMTEEEREDFWKNVLDIDWRELDFDEEPDEVPFPFTENYCGFYLDNFYLAYSFAVIDWLNKKMFDYRGLIEKGLAIEVTEDNNPYNN